MDELTAMRCTRNLLEVLEPQERDAAVDWLDAMLGDGDLSEVHLATATAILTDRHLPYGLMARRTAYQMLAMFNPIARRRAMEWLRPALSVTTGRGPGVRPKGPLPDGRRAPARDFLCVCRRRCRWDGCTASSRTIS
ncbi:hypothetical protein [Streptomyces sp. NPDC014733]|uniref:hypothetical protein n=1 Tax=Streptomyces sp. NPDC014733 TaxID=3364885 RepID=UPI0036F7C71F